MKKRISASLAAILAALLLVSCAKTPAPSAPPTETPVTTPATPVETTATPEITPPDKWELADLWARIDGSTATIPLTSALYDFINGGGDWPPAHNTTPTAYGRLIYGDADLIFVTYPSEEEFAMAKENGVELEIIPVVKDALVFLVNADNPVTGVTTAELQDIYTGKIANWKDVGGVDLDIIPYQRSLKSGSQTLFLKLVMDGVQPMEAPSEWAPAEMGSLVQAVSDYDNSESAVGFSVFYYVNNMYGNSRFRLLSVDGVAPSRDTIARGDYAFEDCYYAVMRKDTPQDSPARKLVDWLLTQDGQSLAVKAGYIPLKPLENVQPDAIDPIYLGDVNSSSGTGGTKLIPDDGNAPAIEKNGVRMPLSDMFFDGFNYIAYINSEIIRQLQRNYAGEGEVMEEMVSIRPFTGIPNSYPNFEVPGYGALEIFFPAGNPFFNNLEFMGYSRSFFIPLTNDISPYGVEPPEEGDFTVTYAYAGQLQPNIALFTLSVNMPKAPDIAARINGQLKAWTGGFPGDQASVDLLTGFIAWYKSVFWGGGDFSYPLQPSYDQWRNYMSVYYLLHTYDGPSIFAPMVYTICFDMDTGDTVKLKDVLPRDLPYENASIMTPILFQNSEHSGGEYMPEGYVPPKGSVITDAWIMYNGVNLYVTEPGGRVLQVNFWEGIE